jgi:hypothetical protein
MFHPTKHTHEREYAAVAATYGVGLTAIATALIRRDKLPERVPWSDIFLGGLATFVVSRRLTRDKITRPLRAPFTDVDGVGAGGELHESLPDDTHGAKRVMGELLSCPFCVSQWLATGFVTGVITAPRPMRTAATVFAVAGIADQLQFVRGALVRAAGEN